MRMLNLIDRLLQKAEVVLAILAMSGVVGILTVNGGVILGHGSGGVVLSRAA